MLNMLLRTSWPFANLHIANIVAIDGETYGCADSVESVLTCCAGVDVQKLVDWVEHHL